MKSSYPTIFTNFPVKTLLFCWLLITAVALAAMFHLWVTREKTMYWGKEVNEKRIAMFKYIGFPKVLLEATNQIQQDWPDEVHYSVRGNADALSYPIYLLLPRRLVSGSETKLFLGQDNFPSAAEHTVINPLAPPADRMAITASVISATAGEQQAPEEPPTPKGLLLALFCISGTAIFLKRIMKRRLPVASAEAFTFGTLLIGITAIAAKTLFHTLTPSIFLAFTLAILGFLSLLIGRNTAQGTFTQRPFTSGENVSYRLLFWACLAVITAGFLWSFLKATIVGPDTWDTWAIWGAKAKMMALGSGPLSDAILTGQRDYPLLWPSLWALTGWLAGGWEEQWSKGWGPILMVVAAAELGWIVSRETKRYIYGLLAAAIFVSVPVVPLVASWGYAEPLLWCMTISCFSMMLQWRGSGNLAFLVLAGLFASGATLCKNEGIIFAGIALLWIFATNRAKLKASLAFLVPLVFIYLLWFLLLKYVAGANYESMPPIALSISELLRKASHLLPAIVAVAKIWADPRQWTLVLWSVGLASIFYAFSGSREVKLNLLIPFLMLCGALATIILRNENFGWQIGAAWNRLTVQALPFMIIAVFCEYGARNSAPRSQNT